MTRTFTDRPSTSRRRSPPTTGISTRATRASARPIRGRRGTTWCACRSERHRDATGLRRKPWTHRDARDFDGRPTWRGCVGRGDRARAAVGVRGRSRRADAARRPASSRCRERIAPGSPSSPCAAARRSRSARRSAYRPAAGCASSAAAPICVSARGRVLLECADTRLETGRLTLVAARSRPARAVLATPQAALHRDPAPAARSSWRSVAGRASGCTRASRACCPPRPRRRCRRCAATRCSSARASRRASTPGRSLPPPSSARATAADRLPAFWADGAPCSVGCRPAGARAGWPLRPFHRQHPLRAGLNERRPANMHKGIDIQAQDGTRGLRHAVRHGARR